jgi:outer membrane protein insertion porin family
LLGSLLTFPLGAQSPSAKQVPGTAPSTEEIVSSYEGQNVSSIEIAGRPDLESSQYQHLFVQHPGEPFSREKVDQTIAALKSDPNFKDVQLQVDPDANGVRILLVLQPAFYFGIFQFPGAERFPYSKLVQIANFPPEAPFNSSDVEQDRQSLLNYFRQEGYFQSEVIPEVKLDPGHAVANVLFHVTLNRLARFGSVDMAGASSPEVATLGARLRTVLARLRGAGIRPGKPYHHSTLTKAQQYLQSQLEKQGHLAARVKLAGAEYHADTNRADIHFDIHTGPEIHVDIQGVHLWSWTRRSLLPVYQGIGVDQESVEEGRQALVSYLQAKGYFDVTVHTKFTKQSKGDTILYEISKEKKHKVSGVTLTGNKQLPSSQLEPHFSVEKAHLFSHGNFSEKLVRATVNNLKAVYQSEGFSDAQVVSYVDNHGGDINVAFRVTEGPRDVVSALAIEGADTFPQSKFAPSGLKLAAGQPYSQAHVEADRANIMSHYLQAGYLTASFRETASVASKNDPHHVRVTYHIYEGPLVYAGDLITLGRDHTQQRLINEDVASIKTAQPLTETQLLTGGSRLYDHTGVFDWAEVDPKRQITTQTKEDILVKVHEAKRNQITYGFGFELINRGGSLPSGTVSLPNLPPVGLPASFKTDQATFYGPRGTFQYTRNNFRGKGESLSFTAFAGRLDQRFAGYFIDPNFRWSRWRATTSLSYENNEENPIFSSRQELGSFQLQRYLDKVKADTLFLRYSVSQTDLTRVEIPALVTDADRHVRLSTVAANFTHDTRDNALDEHKGMLGSTEFDLNTTKLGSSVNFAKFNGQLAYYKQPVHNIVWANSVRIGLAQPFASSRVPLSEKFFTGGGNSLRGFPLDGAGPQRAIYVCSSGQTSPNCPQITVPSGGDELLLINSEARIPLPFKKGLGIVGFYDGGNVFSNVGFHNFTELYSNNVGLGLRYATPVGPVRIDIGRNLNPIPGVGATQYFISIGQAF